MRKLFVVFFAVMLSLTIQAQFNIKGLVLSSSDYSTIMNGTVTLDNEEGQLIQKGYTDRNGYFLFKNVASGNYKLTVYQTGFKPNTQLLSISANKVDLIIELKPLQVLTDEVLVESIKSKKPMANTHTNIGKEEVQKLNIAQDFPVILSTTPGAVYTSDAGAGVGYSGIRIRGIDATRINVTINGVPYNDPESHGVYWVDLPDLAGSVSNIQVQRGIGTSTNGSAAFGSSINIETTKSAVEPYTQYTSAFGSFSTFKNNIKFGTGILKNHWAIEGSLSAIKSAGYIDRATSNLKSGYGTITRYGDKSLLKFIVMRGMETTYQAWDGVPQDSLAMHRTYNGFTYKNQTDNYTQTHYQLLYSYAINKKLNWNTVFHYTKGKGYYESYYPGATFADYGMPAYQINDSTSISTSDLIVRKWLDNDFYGVVTSAVYKEKKYEISGGASFNQYAGLHYNEVIWSDLWTAPKPGGALEPYRYYTDKGLKNDGNAYAKLFYHVNDKLQVFGDLQLRYLTYNFNDANRLNITNKYLFFNPKAGLNYAFKDSSNLMFYVGRSAHEPTRDEFVQSTPASLPKAEYMVDFELGYTKQINHWNIIGNLYNMVYNNQLVLTGKLNDVGSPVRENVKQSYRRGIELIVQRKFNNGLTINANITYSKNILKDYTEYVFKSTDDSLYAYHYATTPISFSPDIIFGSSIRYTTKQHFELELISKYVSRQFMDNSGSEDRKLNAYFVNDFYLRYHFVNQKLFDDLNLSGVLYNVFNTRYESNGYTYGDVTNGVRSSYNFYYPQALQHFVLMVQVKF